MLPRTNRLTLWKLRAENANFASSKSGRTTSMQYLLLVPYSDCASMKYTFKENSTALDGSTSFFTGYFRQQIKLGIACQWQAMANLIVDFQGKNFTLFHCNWKNALLLLERVEKSMM